MIMGVFRQFRIIMKYLHKHLQKYGRLNSIIPSDNTLTDFLGHLYKHTLCFSTVNTTVRNNFITAKCIVGLTSAKKIISHK